MSREYRGRRIVVYPVYFDKSYPRGKGRRVPLRLAVSNPTVDKIVNACKILNLDPEVELEKAHPCHPGLRGRIVVNKVASKTRTLYLIASKMKELEK